MLELIDESMDDLQARTAELARQADAGGRAALGALGRQIKGGGAGRAAFGFSSISRQAAAVERLATTQAATDALQAEVDSLIALCRRARRKPAA